MHAFYTILENAKAQKFRFHNFYSTLNNKIKSLNCSIQLHPYLDCDSTTVSNCV